MPSLLSFKKHNFSALFSRALGITRALFSVGLCARGKSISSRIKEGAGHSLGSEQLLKARERCRHSPNMHCLQIFFPILSHKAIDKAHLRLDDNGHLQSDHSFNPELKLDCHFHISDSSESWTKVKNPVVPKFDRNEWQTSLASCLSCSHYILSCSYKNCIPMAIQTTGSLI